MTNPIIKDLADFYEQNYSRYFQVSQYNTLTRENRAYQTFFNSVWLGGKREGGNYPKPMVYMVKPTYIIFAHGDWTIDLNVIDNPIDRWGNTRHWKNTTVFTDGCFYVLSKSKYHQYCHERLNSQLHSLNRDIKIDDIKKVWQAWLLEHYQEAGFIEKITCNETRFDELYNELLLTTNQYFDSPDWQEFLNYFAAEVKEDNKLWG